MVQTAFNIVQIGYGVLGKAYEKAYSSKLNKVTVIEANTDIVNTHSALVEILHVDDTAKIKELRSIDFITVMVNTPLKGNQLNTSYLYSTLDTIAAILVNNPMCFVLIRSTVPPLFCKQFKLKLELVLGHSVNLGFQPEFLRAKTSYEDASNPWLVVLGHDSTLHPTVLKRFYSLYGQFVEKDRIVVMTLEEAELHKLVHNGFNAMKISFFNSMHLLINKINETHSLDIDSNSISSVCVKTCEGLLNPRYGTTCGHAYYGACLPKDSQQLAYLEHLYGMDTRLFKAVVDVNDVFVKDDSSEVLDGDNHIDTNLMHVLVDNDFKHATVDVNSSLDSVGGSLESLGSVDLCTSADTSICVETTTEGVDDACNEDIASAATCVSEDPTICADQKVNVSIEGSIALNSDIISR